MEVTKESLNSLLSIAKTMVSTIEKMIDSTETKAVASLLKEVDSMPSSPWSAKAKASSKDPLAAILSKYSSMYNSDKEAFERDKNKTLAEVFSKEDLNEINSIMANDTNQHILAATGSGASTPEAKAFAKLREKCTELKGKSDEDILLTFADKGWLVPFHDNYQYLEANKKLTSGGFISSCWVYDIDEFFSRTVKAAILDKYIEPKYGMKKPKKKILRYYNTSQYGVPMILEDPSKLDMIDGTKFVNPNIK